MLEKDRLNSYFLRQYDLGQLLSVLTQRRVKLTKLLESQFSSQEIQSFKSELQEVNSEIGKLKAEIGKVKAEIQEIEDNVLDDRLRQLVDVCSLTDEQKPDVKILLIKYRDIVDDLLKNLGDAKFISEIEGKTIVDRLTAGNEEEKTLASQLTCILFEHAKLANGAKFPRECLFSLSPASDNFNPEELKHNDIILTDSTADLPIAITCRTISQIYRRKKSPGNVTRKLS